MNKLLVRSLGALAAAGVATGALAVSPAQAATTTIQVRPSDFVAPTDTAGGATMQVLSDGVYLKTIDKDGYARAHFKVGVPLADVHAVDYTWYGTDFAPGVYYDIDLDGDGKLDGQFIGESIYGGKDVWLNRDAEDFGSTTTAAGFFASKAPCTGASGGDAQNGNKDGCTSSGNPEAHGSLDDWTRSLKAAGKNPVIYSGGFLLNGQPGAGVLSQVTYGPNKYVFTTDAKQAVTITAEAKKDTVKAKRSIKVSGNVKPVGSGATVTLQVKQNGTFVDVEKTALAASGDYSFSTKAPSKPGRVKLRVVVSETNSTLSGTSDIVKVRVNKAKKKK